MKTHDRMLKCALALLSSACAASGPSDIPSGGHEVMQAPVSEDARDEELTAAATLANQVLQSSNAGVQSCRLGGLDVWTESGQLWVGGRLSGPCPEAFDITLLSESGALAEHHAVREDAPFEVALELSRVPALGEPLSLTVTAGEELARQPLERVLDRHGERFVAPLPDTPEGLSGTWQLHSRDLTTGQSSMPAFARVVQNGNRIEIKELCGDGQIAIGTFEGGRMRLSDPESDEPFGEGVASAFHMELDASVLGTKLRGVRVEDRACGDETAATLITPFSPLMDPVIAPEFALQPEAGYEAQAIELAEGETLILEAPPTLIGRLPNGRSHLLAARETAWPMRERSTQAGNQSRPRCVDSDSGQTISCPPESEATPAPYTECTTQAWREDDMMTLADRTLLVGSSAIYPGALIQGQTVTSGGFAPITIPRSGGTVTMSGVSMADPNLNVGELTFASVEAARQTLVRRPIDSTAANASWRSEQVYSMDDLLLKAGAHVQWNGGAVTAKFQLSNQTTMNHVLVRFTQGLYTLSVPMPSTAEGAFQQGALFDDPDYQLGPNNRPVYVNDVTYGRQLFLLVSSTHSASTIRASIDAAVGGNSASASLDLKSVLRTANVDYVAIGGDVEAAAGPLRAIATGGDVFTALANTAANLDALRTTPTNAAVPIKFSLYDLLDRSQVRAAYSVSYNRQDCRLHSARPYRVELAVRSVNRGVRLWFGEQEGDPDVEISQRHPDYEDYARPVTIDLSAHIARVGANAPVRTVIEHDNGDCFSRFADFEILVEGVSEWREVRRDDGWGHCGIYRNDVVFIDRDVGEVKLARSWRW